MPGVTSHAKTHPQFPVPAVTGSKKACEDNCLSYPPWRYFGLPIILLLLRTNKPMRMDFEHIFRRLRGPRNTVFHLKSCAQKVQVIMALCRLNLQFSRVSILFLKRRNCFFGILHEKEKHKSMLRWPQNGKSRWMEPSNLSGEYFFLPSTTAKTWSVHFQESFEYRLHIKSSCLDFRKQKW